MIDPDTLRAHNYDPDTLKRFDDLIAAPEPPRMGFRPSVSAGAAALIGLIAVQWGMLAYSLDFEIDWNRDNPKIPEELRNKPLRHETKYKIEHLRLIAPYVLAEERKGSLELYQRNLSQISGHKGIRDALVHGSFSQSDNEDFDGAVVQYKRHKLRLTTAALQRVAMGIGECNGFFSSFRDWINAERSRAATESLLQTLIERDHPDTDLDDPGRLSPAPQA